MRNTVLALLVCFIGVSAFGQHFPLKNNRHTMSKIGHTSSKSFQKANGVVYELDSIVWVENLINNPNYYSEDYNFNEEGLNTEKISDLTPMGDYDFVEKEVYAYNVQNMVESITSLVFDTTRTPPTWRLDRKNDFDFNNDGLVSTEYVSRWDSLLDMWVEYNRYTYLYNQLGLDSIKEEVGKNKWTKTYDNQGRLIKEQYAYKSISEWKNGYFHIYTYDSLLNETI
jgi:hypothetical protein